MIADFEDFCLHLYVLVDDLWARSGSRYRRPGPAPACSDSELITLVLAGECRGWDQETDLVAAWQAYRSAAVAAALQAEAAVTLFTVPRGDERAQLPPAVVHQHAHWREIVETVNGQLGEQFHLEANHAKTFWGLCARLYSKLTAHTLCVYLNRQLGQPNCLQIKGLAFAN